ncbi:MAG: UDP-N-acetylmuramoyl-L-alanyl-D-glutamate--2,6-diaminopimelate ligase [Candidatus Delongbacteria bacterium]|jgi:UDP-N-acetylmuramoyl-L-alanyl-D-glutamate--2,6-diaminopimelate ligase|nr:UDP-N-acetylmuramoyl-L-alanyl-D-glutamate--2,6-diaminopimelate ligase [Candidatus Delongbacteria bacterium]MDD4204974.1 UDP-N-acetylmuramoyl-L-alanyl-D-glutamate--2,6-diaminopimelate ligase [Candidatus Delongbacteria bacterium]MDY0017607.1 UDP-N-acetylmuramoyl-L-alanyl-D-glutamate--2,6-diaminopimelate ligase [Candidatus Delongbacteria bacterium]
MKLSKVISEIATLKIDNFRDADIQHVFSDSREKFKNSLFIAVKGLTSDGASFSADAVESGACAVIYETEIIRKFPNITYIKVRDSRSVQSKVAAVVYGRPAERLRLTGITGTNGKTSTAYIFRHILNMNKIKCGLLGTTEYDLGKRKFVPSRTTPDAVFLQRYFKEMTDSGLKCAVMEVSSHALSLHRVEDVMFDCAVFTNLSQDHLDFHLTMDEYAKAKSNLFAEHLKKTGSAVLNADDSRFDLIRSSTECEKMTYSEKIKDSDIYIKDIRYKKQGLEIDFDFFGEQYTIGTNLNGRFQAMNISAAVLAAHKAGIPIKKIVSSFSQPVLIPGRLEKVYEGDFTVYVDYAHTPDALLRTLQTVREFSSGKIITVFGCGGNRDHEKRPVMGKIASELSDKVIVTGDNSRYEDTAVIIAEIVKGMSAGNWTEIPDRREATAKAISMAGTGDVVIIAGKGHESYQETDGVKYPYSDRETVINLTGGN